MINTFMISLLFLIKFGCNQIIHKSIHAKPKSNYQPN